MTIHEMKQSYKQSYTDNVELSIFNCGREQCQPGHTWGPGVRDHYLIHLVVAGKGVYQVNGASHTLQEGDLFLAKPNQLITYAADETDPWEYYWVGFNGACANKLVQQTPFSDAHPVHHCKDPQTVREALYNIYLSRGPEPQCEALMTGYLYIFMAHLMKEAREAMPNVGSSSSQYVLAAIKYIQFNYSHDISVDDIAKAVGLSEMTVFRHFPSKYAMLMAAMRRAPYAEMIEDVFTTHVRWELEHDLRHFMRRYMDIAEQRIGIWRIYFSAIGQIDEHSTELVSDVTSFRERLRAYFEEMIRRGHIRQLDSLYVSSLFWNLIFGFVMTLVIGRKRPGLVRDEYIENAVSVFIGGVAPKEGEAWR